MAARKESAKRNSKKANATPKLQKLDAEWKAFIEDARELDPPTQPWQDPSEIKPRRRIGKAPAAARGKAKVAPRARTARKK